ncbi:probable G-protein coupled receptor Mth-like 3 [Nylanderia fulva]|uniref:probable G-protein coupled receptor Mth-like 3 n=1 Tax=Nylanderia fulva TaxID=613905 RepID=UPI0010FBB87B|nr:probable G-protein coupled receptor Mth-like 3 [Nylanderia fulva]XP_029163539.1 probable G-protein coupled receptor Mth-like 3 [Nylanderia fulva]
MGPKYFTLLCCGFFLLITSTKSQQNFTNNEKRGDNLTMQYEADTDSTTIYSDEIKTLRYDMYENFANNAQYVYNHEDDDPISMNSHTNSSNVNHKKNATSQKVYENLLEKNDSMSNEVFENSIKDIERNFVPYEMCHNITCIQFCCPLGTSMIESTTCVPDKTRYEFPQVYEYENDSMQNENKRADKLYRFAVYDPCLETQRYLVERGHQDNYKIFANGSIYLSFYKKLFDSKSYCIVHFLNKGTKFEVTVCSETHNEIYRNAMKYLPELRWRHRTTTIYASMLLVRLLFLLPIFIVYSVLPELRSVHGFMLRNYTFAASVAIIIKALKLIYYQTEMTYPACITLAFFHYICSMSCSFWLLTMSFNMWRTFRGFFLLQKRIRKSEKKSLLYYAIFAYGCPFILGIICVIAVDFFSNYIPKNLRPEFETGNCWYNGARTGAFLLYFFWIQTACIISSVWLSISAAQSIKHYEKDTNLHLSDSESKQYNENKKWFNLYMKLFILVFIIMAMYWTTLIIAWLFENRIYYYLSYVTASLEILTSFCTFIMFVWKKEIKMMLLKRFGYGTIASSPI